MLLSLFLGIACRGKSRKTKGERLEVYQGDYLIFKWYFRDQCHWAYSVVQNQSPGVRVWPWADTCVLCPPCGTGQDTTGKQCFATKPVLMLEEGLLPIPASVLCGMRLRYTFRATVTETWTNDVCKSVFLWLSMQEFKAAYWNHPKHWEVSNPPLDSAWSSPHNKQKLSILSSEEVQIWFQSQQLAFFAICDASTYPMLSRHNYHLKTKIN